MIDPQIRLGRFIGVVDIIFPESNPRSRRLEPSKVDLTQYVKVPGFEGPIGELLRRELKKSGQPGLDDYPSILYKYLTLYEEIAFENADLTDTKPTKTLTIILPKEEERFLDGPAYEGEVVEWWTED